MEEKSIALYKTEGSADKEYHVILEQDGDGFRVFFKNGRRGKALRSGEKTKAPLPYEDALAMYEKTVKSKTKTGYTEDVSGAAFSSAEYAGQHTGFRPQLLNDVTDEEALELSKQKTPEGDDVWWVQEKHDGERRGIIHNDRFVFSNKRGLEVSVNKLIEDDLTKLEEAYPDLFPLDLDAEDMGDHVVVFDITRSNGNDAKDLKFAKRRDFLVELNERVDQLKLTAIKVDVPIPASEFFAGYGQKIGKRRQLEQSGAEGYVMQNGYGTYTVGRPNSGGGSLRRKFWASCTARVGTQNGDKSSVSLEMQEAPGNWINVGNVTIPANSDIPADGSLIEVMYLYAYEGGSIYQPIYKGPRPDQGEEACMVSTLKIKGKAEPEEAPAPAAF